jgi:hypothetical protein
MDKVRELYRTICWCGAAAKYKYFAIAMIVDFVKNVLRK